jgi:hypothetical protein
MKDRSSDRTERLDALLDGRSSDVPDDLAPLVEAARSLSAAMLAHELDATVQAAHLERIQRTEAERSATRSRSRWHRYQLVLAITVAVVALLIPAFTAAGTALPGQALYPLKRVGEQVRLAAAITPERQAAERTRLAMRRCEEFEQLAATGRDRRLDVAKDDLSRSLSSARRAIDKARVDGATSAAVARWRARLAQVEQEARQMGAATSVSSSGPG